MNHEELAGLGEYRNQGANDDRPNKTQFSEHNTHSREPSYVPATS